MKKIFLIALLIFGGCANRQTVKTEQKQEIPGRIQFTGGSGDSFEDAVVITGVHKQHEGLDAEYSFISDRHGIKNKDWRVVGQAIIREKGSIFDVIEISIGNGSDRRIYYFDVTAFPWKKKS
jgi:hypothetical protein